MTFTPGSTSPLSTINNPTVPHATYFLGQRACVYLPLSVSICATVKGSTAAPYVALLCPAALIMLILSPTDSPND
eukprot:4515815-Heterocapsa_arctica.AAC.1